MSRSTLFTGVVVLAASMGCAGTPEQTNGRHSAAPLEPVDTRARIATLLSDLARVYAPADGLTVARHIPPFPSAREEVLTLLRGADMARRRPAVIWSLRGGALEPVSYSFGDSPEVDRLEFVLATMARVDLQDIEGAARTLPLTGDFVFLAGTPAERIVGDLETVVRDAVPPPGITLHMVEMERDVSVARGRFTYTPLPGRERNELEIFGSSRPARADSSGSGDLGEFLRVVGDFSGRRVIDSVDDAASVAVRWRYADASMRAGDATEISRVLENVSRQTGLTFSTAKRRVRIIEIQNAATRRAH
jgi:hypothetical protein